MTPGIRIRIFLPELYEIIRPLLGLYIVAWLVTCAGLIVVFRLAKPLLRAKAIELDQMIRARAHRVRFRSHEHEDETLRRERVALTWFFRFWTNFASAPCLMTLSLLVPFCVFNYRIDHSSFFKTYVEITAAWTLPGLCYSGSMLLSFVLKRVFKRLRPPLKKGDFGHKLIKDPSFPSGHSLTSFCFWAMVPVAAALTLSGVATVALLALAGATIVLLTGMSRIYLRVHFPSDVAGGFIIGAVWSVVCLLLLPSALANSLKLP